MKRAAILLFIILLFAASTIYFLRDPGVQTFSGAIEDGFNAYGLHGMHQRTIDFSPDGRRLSYLWSDCTYVRDRASEGRPLTLTESLEVRVRSTAADHDEIKIPLDSVDFRPQGAIYYLLDASLSMSPDSRHLSALCSRRLVLVDLEAKTNRRIEYAGEFFGTSSWLDADTLIFSTRDQKGRLIFWKYGLGTDPGSRSKVCEAIELPQGDGAVSDRVPELNHDEWSPDGRFVCFTIPSQTNKPVDAILDAKTGMIRRFPFSLYYQCWKPDSSQLLVDDKFGTPPRTFLIDPVTGETDDISTDLTKEFGTNYGITLVAPVWTPDGKYVVLYTTSSQSTAVQVGYLIQPRPFKAALSTKHIMHWSPFAGWILLQGDESFKWINYEGNVTARIQGWPNDWTWSADGHLAARIEDGNIEILKPQLPPGLKAD